MAYRLLSADDIKAFPEPTWLVHGILPAGGLSVLYGPPKIGKSFIALDLAHSLAVGVRWLNKRTERGFVVYVAAGEGVPGLRNRIEAWEHYHRRPVEGVGYITEPVQLHQPAQITKLIKTIEQYDPALVIFDTLARCFVGGDENSVQDMGRAVGAADEIRRSGAAVMFIHHTGRPDDKGRVHERGSTALPSAVDTMMELTEGKDDPAALTLVCRFQKDSALFSQINFRMKKVNQRFKQSSLVPVV